MNSELTETVEKFLDALENRKDSKELLSFYHPDIEQVEFPNTLTKHGATRNLEELQSAAEKGKSVLSRERYEIINKYILNSAVIIEAVWTGVLSVPIGKLQPGDEMKAYFAQFYEFKNGKIIKQRNYDCFEPFD